MRKKNNESLVRGVDELDTLIDQHRSMYLGAPLNWWQQKVPDSLEIKMVNSSYAIAHEQRSESNFRICKKEYG